MLGASLYIIVCSARNRVRMRLRRLREPRYLVGGLVGAAYIYFSFFARYRVGRRSAGAGRGRQAQIPASLRAAGPALVGILFMVLAAFSWIMPFDSGLLDFSDAEVQFLFPAPVPRRQLLLHRLLRSQIGMLFGAAVVGFGAGFTLSGWTRLRVAVAAWLMSLALKLYFTGVTLARTRLAARDTRSRGVAWTPLAILTTALTVVFAAMWREYQAAPHLRGLDVMILAGRASMSGVAGIVLWPFAALTAPMFAPWPLPYLAALGGAMLVTAALGAWVIASDGVFQEATAEVAARRGQQSATAGTARYKVRSTGWALASLGRPELALAWKGAMQTTRTVDKRSIARVVALFFAIAIASASLGRSAAPAAILGAFSLMATVFMIVLGPQVLRSDMREDLAHLAMLRTWPIKASAVVRGELLWPGALITVSAWTTLAVAAYLSGITLGDISIGLRLSGAAAVAFIAPSLVFAQLTILNAIALLFPAWVPLGSQRARGLDAMGQRLIMMGGTWLLMVVALLPGAIVGGIIWFALQQFIGHAALIPAAVVCTAIVGIEVLLATEALGPVYERLDVMAVEKAE
ncbi:MAG TPA: hypothetical protein VGG73_22335 [Vicinamibacterales bacterium]